MQLLFGQSRFQRLVAVGHKCRLVKQSTLAIALLAKALQWLPLHCYIFNCVV